MTLRVTCSLQDLFFKNIRLRRFNFKKEASCTHRITVSAILICLQGYFSKFFASGGLKWKQVTHEAWLWVPFSYVYCYMVYFSKNFASGGLRRKQITHCTSNDSNSKWHSHICLQGLFFKNFRLRRFKHWKEVTHEEWRRVPFSYV